MAEGKKGFILYADQKELFDQLPDDKAGQLIKHIFKYVNDEDPESDDLIINLAFTSIRQQLKRDLKKYENICDRNKLNGQKGGRPKNPKEPKKPSGLLGNPKKPKKPDKDNDKDNDNDNDIDNDIDNVTVNVKEKKTKKEDAAKSGPPDEYKNICKMWFEFVKQRTGVKPKFNGVDGKSLKQIIHFISQTQNEGQKTEDTFQYILNNWNSLEPWLQSNALDLKIFNSKINIIIDQLKNGTGKQKDNRFNETLHKHFEATHPNYKDL